MVWRNHAARWFKSWPNFIPQSLAVTLSTFDFGSPSETSQKNITNWITWVGKISSFLKHYGKQTSEKKYIESIIYSDILSVLDFFFEVLSGWILSFRPYSFAEKTPGPFIWKITGPGPISLQRCVWKSKISKGVEGGKSWHVSPNCIIPNS